MVKLVQLEKIKRRCAMIRRLWTLLVEDRLTLVFNRPTRDEAEHFVNSQVSRRHLIRCGAARNSSRVSVRQATGGEVGHWHSSYNNAALSGSLPSNWNTDSHIWTTPLAR